MEAKKLRRFKNGRFKKKNRAIDINNIEFSLNENGGSNDIQVN